MDLRINHLRTQIQECDNEIKKLRESIRSSRGHSQHLYKQRALQVMRRRNMLTKQLDTLFSQQMNVEQVQFSAQSIQDTIQTVGAFKQAYSTQKQLMKNMDIDDIADIMEDMQDIMLDTDEVNEILARNYDVEIDEADLDEELAELDKEILDEDISAKELTAPSYLPGKKEEIPSAPVEEHT